VISLPPCPHCSSGFTYLDGERFVCPACGHEWQAAADPGEEDAGRVVRDAVGSVLADGDTVTVIKDLKVKGGRPTSSSAASTSTSTPLPKGDERKAQTLNEKSLEFSKRQLEREESRVKQEKAEAEAKERAQRCEQAQAYVRNLQAGGRATRLMLTEKDVPPAKA